MPWVSLSLTWLMSGQQKLRVYVNLFENVVSSGGLECLKIIADRRITLRFH